MHLKKKNAMVDVEKQVSYWKEVAADDWRVANKLLAGKETLSALFFAHLAMEKILKAHVCRHTQDYAPMIHNLLSLAQRASLPLSSERERLLAEPTTYNIRGRYPDMRGGHIESRRYNMPERFSSRPRKCTNG